MGGAAAGITRRTSRGGEDPQRRGREAVRRAGRSARAAARARRRRSPRRPSRASRPSSASAPARAARAAESPRWQMKPGQHEPDVDAVRRAPRGAARRSSRRARTCSPSTRPSRRARRGPAVLGDVDDRARRRARSSGSSASVSRTTASKLTAIVPLDVLPAAVGERGAPGGAGVVDEQAERPCSASTSPRRAAGASSSVRSAATRWRPGSASRQRPQPVLAPRDEHELQVRLARRAVGRWPRRSRSTRR